MKSFAILKKGGFMKKLLLSSLLASCLFCDFVNATEIENYPQEAKQILLKRLHHENASVKFDGASHAKLYDKDGNLILEMNLNLENNEEVSLKQMPMPWEGVAWYVYDENGKKYEMTDTEKSEIFMEISSSMSNFIGKIQ